jgi:hypothetical protein
MWFTACSIHPELICTLYKAVTTCADLADLGNMRTMRAWSSVQLSEDQRKNVYPWFKFRAEGKGSSTLLPGAFPIPMHQMWGKADWGVSWYKAPWKVLLAKNCNICWAQCNVMLSCWNHCFCNLKFILWQKCHSSWRKREIICCQYRF